MQLSRREENAAATRDAIVRAASKLFAKRGYANVSTGEVAESARVTRGALYHYFADKRELMRAVFEQADGVLVGRARDGSEAIQDPWARMLGGIDAFLDALMDRDLLRIVFVEAPAALGWSEWRELDAGKSVTLVAGRISEAVDSGVMRAHSPIGLAHLVLGALNEAGMFVAASRDPARARDAVRDDLHALLSGLRA